MKFCTKCGTQCDDMANCCHKCGNRFADAAAPAAAVYVDPHDHTGEMDKSDIASNKVFAVVASLLPAMPFILFYVEQIKVLYGRSLDWLHVFLGNYGSPAYFVITTIMAIIAIALLGFISKDSKFAAFHTKQALKVVVLNLPIAFLSVVPFIGWPVASLLALFVAILSIIQFFSACAGKAKDVPCVGSAKFLG